MIAAVLARGGLAFLFWLMLAGTDPAALAVGALAAAAATWASLALLPPGAWRISPAGLARLVLRFPGQSVLAGVDVARRALRPDLPIRPGIVAFPSRLPPGTARTAFGTLTSLLPGTLPLGADETGAERIHCLDLDQPVVALMRAEEGRFLAAIRRDG